MKETISIDGIEWNLKKELRIDEANILQQMLEHSSKVVFWGRRLARAKESREFLEKAIKLVEANLYLDIKKKAEEEGEKITAPTLTAKTRASVEWAAWNDKLQSVRKEELNLVAIMEAFSHRRDMFISAGAQIRSEQNISIGRRNDVRSLRDLVEATAATRNIKQQKEKEDGN